MGTGCMAHLNQVMLTQGPYLVLQTRSVYLLPGPYSLSMVAPGPMVALVCTIVTCFVSFSGPYSFKVEQTQMTAASDVELWISTDSDPFSISKIMELVYDDNVRVCGLVYRHIHVVVCNIFGQGFSIRSQCFYIPSIRSQGN